MWPGGSCMKCAQRIEIKVDFNLYKNFYSVTLNAEKTLRG